MAFASFVIISDTELISAAAPALADQIRRQGPVEEIVTAEAKGIALAYEISRLLGLKRFIVARKSRKSYMRDAVRHGKAAEPSGRSGQHHVPSVF